MIKLSFAESPEFSQWGEELAVEQILQVLDQNFPRSQRYLVEFGASRGPDNSNFWKFRDQRDLVLIEADEKRYSELVLASKPHTKVRPLLMRLGTTDGIDNLNFALQRLLIDVNLVSGVSIDIDSDDAAVFESIGFLPEFVIVEHNPTLPSDGRFRNPMNSKFGNNIGELLAVGAQMGLYPAGLTQTNLILCHQKLASSIEKINVSEELKKLDLPRFGFGYDGTVIRFSTNGSNTTSEIYHNGWSGNLLIQPTPRILRGYQDSKIKRFFRVLHSRLRVLFLVPLRVKTNLLRKEIEKRLEKVKG